jgi:hypothetical protein
MSNWNDLYNKKVWVQYKPNSIFWPSFICDPNKLSNLKETLKTKANSLLGKKYLIRYLGMPESSAYGLISESQIKQYTDTNDSYFKQSIGVRNAKYYAEGIKEIQRDIDPSIYYEQAGITVTTTYQERLNESKVFID